jgi:hypothetical protein
LKLAFHCFGALSNCVTSLGKRQSAVSDTSYKRHPQRRLKRADATGYRRIVNTELSRSGTKGLTALYGEQITKVVPIRLLHHCSLGLQDFAFNWQLRRHTDMSGIQTMKRK